MPEIRRDKNGEHLCKAVFEDAFGSLMIASRPELVVSDVSQL